MSKSINMLTTSLAMAVVGTVALGLVTARPASAACAIGPSSAPYGNGMDVYCSPDPVPAPAPAPERGPIVPKCMTTQNAWRPCTPAQRPSTLPANVDPEVVGTWDLYTGGGKWVLQVFANGTFEFHSEAPDGVQPSSGTFSAHDNNWSLIRSDGYTDGGKYRFQSHDIWVATGNFGPGTWIRRP